MKMTLIPTTIIKHAHPKGLKSYTDAAYAKLASDVCEALQKVGIEDITLDGLKTIATNIALYFEDIVADAGIWRGFTDGMKEKYGKFLPFYDVSEEEYYQDEPNLADVKFLVWYTMLEVHAGKVGNPENRSLQRLAEAAYDVLDRNFETIPVNEELKDFFLTPGFTTDFYKLRDVLKWLCFDCYLTYEINIEDSLYRITAPLAETIGFGKAYYQAECYMPFNIHVGPLYAKPAEWLSLILRANGNAADADKVAGITSTAVLWYKLMKTDAAKGFTFKDPYGETIRVSQEELNAPENLPADKVFANACFVRYDNAWHLNGGCSWIGDSQRYDESVDIAKQQKAVGSLYAKLIEENGGSPLFYFADDKELAAFLKEHFGKRSNTAMSDVPKNKKYIVMYVPSDGKDDIELHPDGALSVKDERNPFYQSKAGRNLAFNFALTLGDAACAYMLGHDMLPDATINSVYGLKRGNEIVQQNFAFMVGAVTSRL